MKLSVPWYICRLSVADASLSISRSNRESVGLSTMSTNPTFEPKTRNVLLLLSRTYIVRYHSHKRHNERERERETTRALFQPLTFSLVMSRINQRMLTRVYPFGTRFTSSNFHPNDSWNVGCQLVHECIPPLSLQLGCLHHD